MTDSPEAARQKAFIGGLFDRASRTYDQVGIDFFRIVSEEVVRRCAPVEGERILDLGCGRGASAVPAARLVGPSGRVLGVDLAPGMVDSVNEAARNEGLPQLSATVGDAERPDVPSGDWDAIQASLVLFFLPDLARALQRYRELLAPSGRLVFSWFGPSDPDWQPLHRTLEQDLGEDALAPRKTGREGPFAGPDAIAAALAAAGFSQVSTEESAFDIVFDNAAHWWEWMWSAGGRAGLEQLEQRGLLEAAAERVNAWLADRLQQTGELRQTMNLRYTVAR